MLGKQFSTCKYKKYKLLSVTTGKLFEGYDNDERKAYVFLSSFFFMFIQHFHPMQESIWIVRARIIVTLTVRS